MKLNKLIILNIIQFNIIKCFIFSVIISIYNTGRYLGDSIGSLLNQTIGFENIQIILINDGSTDDSEMICLKYKKLYNNNIIYVKIGHSGVSKVRNIGLNYAQGKYINFLDSDDKWDKKAFEYVYLFFKFYKNINLIGCRIKYFELSDKFHFLDYKFKKTRILDLNKEYNFIHLSVSSSFFKRSITKGKKFKEGLFYGEDVRYIANILLINPIMGLIREAIYYYRKRSDLTSSMQNTENNIDFYLLTIQSVQKYLIEKSIKLYDIILPFIQFYEVYDILFRIQSKAYKFLDSNTYNEYCKSIIDILNQIEDKYFLEQNIFTPKIIMYALSIKYKTDLRENIILQNNSLIYRYFI